MDKQKIAKFIKQKRKENNMTQEDLAKKLYVTEKAVSRWETGRGTPDISLLIPLSEILKVSVADILNANEKTKDNINDVINYIEINKQEKNKLPMIISTILYILSILTFLTYLKLDYSGIHINYLLRLFIVLIASLFIIISNYIININYIEKIADTRKIKKLTHIILFLYYSILIFNMTLFSRNKIVISYNIKPFKTILNIINNPTHYNLTIDLLGNFLIFMPINYFLIELFQVEKPLKNIFTSFVIVLLFEILQYVFKIGVFDVDDLIICSLGMTVFYIIYMKIKGIKKQKKNWKGELEKRWKICYNEKDTRE